MLLFLSIIIFFVVIILTLDTFKPRDFPPGPPWLPLVGNYLYIRKTVKIFGYYHLVWRHLRLIYGDVVGVRIGRDRIVIISGVEAINEVLSREEFEGRPDGFFFTFRTFGKRQGIVFLDGLLWQEQRRFTVKYLRHFGFGKREMKYHIAVEARSLVEHLKNRPNKSDAYQLNNVFEVYVLNVLWVMLAGTRFEIEDARITRLLELMHESFRLAVIAGGLLNQMPFLRYLAPVSSGYLPKLNILNNLYEFFEETINEHQKTRCPGAPRDYIDAFIQEMEDSAANPESTFTRQQLLSVCLDLFFAGTETTSATLAFSMLYMLRYPNIQTLVQNELDVVIGRERWPELHDRVNLPYTEAVLIEIQRISNVAPVGVAHRAVCDTKLRGHFVPAGTMILINLADLHTDESLWGSEAATDFRPERHLNKDGSLCRPSEDVFKPFGVGRRRCLGEGLAKSSMFIFFTAMLHNFKLKISPDYPLLPPSSDYHDGFSLSPKPFHAILVPRT